MRKNILLISLFNISLCFSQIGIGIEEPRGILDLNNSFDEEYGLVLPSNENVEKNIINPQGGKIAPGTIVYDKSDDCIKYYRSKDESGWSKCIRTSKKPTKPEKPPIPSKYVFIGYAGAGTIGTKELENFNNQLTDNNNYGDSGTFRGVNLILADLNEALPKFEDDSLLDAVEILFIGDYKMTPKLVSTLKYYVDHGGVLIMTYPEQNLYKAFGGKGVLQNNTTSIILHNITNNSINNGIFGNVTGQSLLITDSNSNKKDFIIPKNNLPTNIQIFSEHINNIGAYTTGTDGRAIFFRGNHIFLNDISGSIDKPNEIFIHNIMSYALQKAGYKP